MYYIEDIIRKEESITEWQIWNIHQLILKNIDDEMQDLSPEKCINFRCFDYPTQLYLVEW